MTPVEDVKTRAMIFKSSLRRNMSLQANSTIQKPMDVSMVTSRQAKILLIIVSRKAETRQQERRNGGSGMSDPIFAIYFKLQDFKVEPYEDAL